MNDYEDGIVMGYYSIIATFKNKGFVLCVDQHKIGLADIKPDRDLLGLALSKDIEEAKDNWKIDPITEENLELYLIDVIALLQVQLQKAQEELDTSDLGSREYKRGGLDAYQSTFDLLKKQAMRHSIEYIRLGFGE